jgi:hypothetical protein
MFFMIVIAGYIATAALYDKFKKESVSDSSVYLSSDALTYRILMWLEFFALLHYTSFIFYAHALHGLTKLTPKKDKKV